MTCANTDGNENNDINACSKTYKNKHTQALQNELLHKRMKRSDVP